MRVDARAWRREGGVKDRGRLDSAGGDGCAPFGAVSRAAPRLGQRGCRRGRHGGRLPVGSGLEHRPSSAPGVSEAQYAPVWSVATLVVVGLSSSSRWVSTIWRPTSRGPCTCGRFSRRRSLRSRSPRRSST